MKRPGHQIGSVPAVLRGGPADGQVIRLPELLPEIKFPIQPDFTESVSKMKAIDKTPTTPNYEVAVYARSGTETSLQLPFPAPKEAKRIGFEYEFLRTEKA